MPGIRVDARELRSLDLELKAANRTLRNTMRRNLRAATLPARQAVQAEERRVLPKRGGLNEWVASTPVRHSMTTPARGAVVSIRQGKKVIPGFVGGADTTGVVRHPNRGGPRWSMERRDKTGGWSVTHVPTGWFERPLLAMAPRVEAAMVAVMDETARVAGFH